MIDADNLEKNCTRAWLYMLPAAVGLLAIAPARAADPPLAEPPRSLRPGDPHAHGLTDKDLAEIRAILRGAVEDQVVPGISLLLAHRGEIIFKEAYGDIKPDQKVQMASSSKTVTATLLMILVDQGKLKLDDPVEKYLPEFKDIKLNGRPPAHPPTVRQLLSNMSGLPGDLLTQSIMRRLRERAAQAREKGQPKPLEDKALADAVDKAGQDARNARAQFFDAGHTSLAASVRRLAREGLATEPGSGFHYCTMGFNVAAWVAEVAGGRPFEDLVRDELFEPLGLKDTRYVPFGLQALRPGPRLADGESRFLIAGGGMTSTLDDFAAFYQMHLNGGTDRGHRILSERSAAAMRTRQGRLDLMMSGPYGNHYGLAFFLDRIDAHGRGHVTSHPGLFGTNPWLDADRQLVGILVVQSNFLRVIPTVRRLRETLDAALPASSKP